MMDTKTRFSVLHPFLFAVYPSAELFFKLSPGVPFSAIVRSLLVALGAAGLCLWLFYHLERNWERAAFVTTILLLTFLFYGQLYYAAWNWHFGHVRIGRHEILFPLWVVLLGTLGSRWAWRRFRSPQVLTGFLNVTIVAALVFSSGRYVLNRSTRGAVSAHTPATVGLTHAESVHLEQGQTPDIYYIIPDGYARADVLQQLYELDNTEFLTALQERGFYVTESSQSNYTQTSLSLASSLNFDYLEATPVDAGDRDALTKLLQHSRTRRLLTQLGYRWIVVESGYDITEMKDADVYLSAGRHLSVNNFEGLLIISSAAAVAIDWGWLSVPVAGRANYVQVRYAFEQLPEIAQLPGPKFVFCHIISPHPPFVLDRNGRFVPPSSPYMSSIDGVSKSEPPEVYTSGYIEKLLYTNRMLLSAVDEILAHSEIPPIIIIQSDHGSGLLWNLNSLEDTCLWERFAILNAYRFPGNGTQALYPEITPVNTFRVIFDTYWGTNLGLLEDRSYFSTWERPYVFQDVTARVELPCVER